MNGNRWTLVVTWGLLVLALVLMGLMAGQSGHAQPVEVAAPRAELRVCTEGPPSCDYAVIQDAVDAAAEGDVVKVAAGVYTGVQARPAPPDYDGPAVITQAVYLSKTLTLRGGYTLTNWTEPDPEANPTTLDAEGQGRVMAIAGTISPMVENLRLTGGDATDLGGHQWEYDAGGGLYAVTAMATISNCVIYDNIASTADNGSGGGLHFLYSDDATLNSNTIVSNTAEDGGGLFLNGGDGVTLSDNRFAGNVAGRGGGLRSWYSEGIILTGNTFVSNTANAFGGGLWIEFYDSDIVLTGNLILSNTAGQQGGGASIWGDYGGNGTVTLTGNTVQGNTVSFINRGEGGGLYFSGTTVTLNDNLVRNNIANTIGDGEGGGLYLAIVEATLSGNTFANNIASIGGEGQGGGLYGGGNTLEGNTFVDNIASIGGEGWGGGLYGYATALNGNTFIGNTASTTATGYGGGLYLWIGDVVSNNLVLSNTASAAADGYGGGLYVGDDGGTLSGNVVLSNTATLSPTAIGQGGGLYFYENDGATLNSNTIAHNTAGDGGGLYFHVSGSTTLNSNTIVSNTAGSGGGLLLYDSDGVTLSDNRFAGNVAGRGGGLCSDYSDAAMLIGNTFISNTVGADGTGGAGGGLWIEGFDDVVLTGNMILSNTAGSGGGGAVIWGWDEDSTATLIGNTVQGNTASFTGGMGGGLYINDTTVTLSDNLVQNNIANTTGDGWGGGLYLAIVEATLSGNTFANNIASIGGEGQGGGLYGGGITLEGNTFADNIASIGGQGWGGGLYGGVTTLNDNTFAGNTASTTATGYGGGLCLWIGDVASDNLVLSNTASAAADGYGGGLYVGEDGGTLSGNVVLSNTATLSPTAIGQGGGLYVEPGQDLELVNNVVAGNQAHAGAGGYGSGLWFDGEPGEPTNGTLLHTTIASNAAGGSGQGVYVDEFVTLTFINTIVSGHGDTGVFVDSGGTATLEGTLWHGNGADTGGEGTIVTGTVNIYGDPAFVDPSVGDYHLGSGSAAIDTGVDAGVIVDVDGDPRPMGLGFDIGADEFRSAQLAIVKQAGPDPVAAGAQLTYTLHLTNTGLVSFTATVTDFLPAHVTPGGVLVWTPVPLVPDEVWSETVVVTVDVDYTGPLTNVVRATAEEGASGAYTRTVTVVDTPIEGLTAVNDSPTVLEEVTTLTATVTAGSNVSYTWAFDDGTFGSGSVVTHIYPAEGVYTAVVTASNSVSELTATTQAIITGDEIPIEGLVAINDSPTVLGEATTLTATVTASSNVTYTWALGDGTSGSGSVVSHIYPTTGVYTAVVTAGNSVSELTATTRVTIVEPGFSVYLPLVVKER